MPSLLEEFGSMVRHHRLRQGLTQAQLAEKIEHSVEMIGRIERGESPPSFDMINEIAEGLRTPVRDLFGSGDRSISGRKGDKLAEIVTKLGGLDNDRLRWIDRLLTAALDYPKR